MRRPPHTLPHLAARVFNTALLIEPAKLQAILHVVSGRIGVTAAEIDGTVGSITLPRLQLSQDDRRKRRSFAVEGGIALIDVFGTLVHRGDALDAQSGLTSYELLREQVQDAGTDPDVKGILLTVDSAGGEASGAWDFADDLRAVAALKPTWAVVDSMAFSAGYLIASQADRVILTQGAGVGSVGVIALHVDQSEAERAEGLKITAIYAGAHKNDLSPHQPLNAAGEATMHKLVNDQLEIFAGKVARGRGLSADRVKATEAGLFFGQDALNAGFADSMGTLQTAFAEMREQISGGGRKAVALKVEQPEPSPVIEVRSEVKMDHETKTPAGVEAAQPPVSAAAVAPTVTKLSGDECLEIMEVCKLMGKAELAHGLIKHNLSPAKVREQLINQLADGQEQTQVNASTMPADGMNVNAGFLAGRMKATLAERGIKHANA